MTHFKALFSPVSGFLMSLNIYIGVKNDGRNKRFNN